MTVVGTARSTPPRVEDFLSSEDFGDRAAVAAADPDAPRFHVAPPFGRLNDPNGLLFHDGVAHAFYQWAPGFPDERRIGWGHARSRDLLRWTTLPPAIAPADAYDRDGCYSGSALAAGPDASGEQTRVFYYTGNVKLDDGSRQSNQAAFVTRDLRSFQKIDQNPLIPDAERPATFTAHFRDPFLFATPLSGADTFRMCIGAQRTDGTGAIALFSSDRPLGPWCADGELDFDGPNAAPLRTLGAMWECPAIFRLWDEVESRHRDVVLFCPQEVRDPALNPLGRADLCGYVVGDLDGTMLRNASGFRELDPGFDFYAPQLFADAPGGAAILMAWLGNAGEDALPSLREHGWVHTLSVPRRLVLRAGVLLQQPAFDAADFGAEHALELPETLGAAPVPLTVLGESRSVLLDLEAALDDGALVLTIGDRSRVTVRLTADELSVDRNASRYPAGGSRTVQAPRAVDRGSVRRLRVLHDRSVTEVFVDDGATTFSFRSFVDGGGIAVAAESRSVHLRAASARVFAEEPRVFADEH